MSIKQSTTSFFYADTSYAIEEAAWICICDKCGSRAHTNGRDPGDCADMARKSGFVVVCKNASEPGEWRCKDCKV